MELYGARLVLTSASLDDAEALLPAFNGDEQFNRWSGDGPVLSLDLVRADMQETLDLPGGVVWRITHRAGSLIGVAATACVRPGRPWIGLLLIRREFQRRGYGTEAAGLLEEYLFSLPDVEEVGLAVLVQNAPALVFWERRGYVRVEHRRDNHGREVYSYSLSRSAFKAH